MKTIDLIVVQKKIGYVFEDWRLLFEAFTHSSYANEYKTASYERLEFLGDSILNFVISKYLFEHYSNENEGVLTKMRSNLVSKRTLSAAIDNLQLIQWLRTSGGENDILQSTTKKEDLFEAIVGAIMVDSGSIDACKKFIMQALEQFIDEDYFMRDTDYKSALNEYCHQKGIMSYYNISKSSDNIFTAELVLDGVAVAQGQGKSKKKAEQHAASIYLSDSEGKAREKIK